MKPFIHGVFIHYGFFLMQLLLHTAAGMCSYLLMLFLVHAAFHSYYPSMKLIIHIPT